MNPFKGRHFQRDIILWAVRWYCKYGISYRELQEMLAEPRQPGGCKLKTAPVRPVVAARPAEYVCSEDLFY